MLRKIGSLTNLKVVNTKFAKKEIEPFDRENFIYFTARAVSAYETDGWNENGDAFLWEELKKAYPTFIGKNLFLDHQTHPLNTVGKVIDAYPVDEPNSKYIECLCKVDRKSFPNLARNIETGVLNSVSMGASVGRSICSVCGYTIRTDMDPKCDHMLNLLSEYEAVWDYPKANIKRGQKINAFFLNEDIRFTELSIVTNPADSKALVRSVFANVRPIISFEKKDPIVHSKWKVVYPNKVALSIPIYSIGVEGKLSYFSSSSFGNQLSKYASLFTSRELISNLNIGGDFMKELEKKLKDLIKREEEEEEKDLSTLKEVLSLMKNPEKNYVKIVQLLNDFIKMEKSEVSSENEDVSIAESILNEFKSYFNLEGTLEEEEEEKEEEENVEVTFSTPEEEEKEGEEEKEESEVGIEALFKSMVKKTAAKDEDRILPKDVTDELYEAGGDVVSGTYDELPPILQYGNYSDMSDDELKRTLAKVAKDPKALKIMMSGLFYDSIEPLNYSANFPTYVRVKKILHELGIPWKNFDNPELERDIVENPNKVIDYMEEYRKFDILTFGKPIFAGILPGVREFLEDYPNGVENIKKEIEEAQKNNPSKEAKRRFDFRKKAVSELKEREITKDPEESLYFAKHVLKDAFPEGEDAIIENEDALEEYMKFLSEIGKLDDFLKRHDIEIEKIEEDEEVVKESFFHLNEKDLAPLFNRKVEAKKEDSKLEEKIKLAIDEMREEEKKSEEKPKEVKEDKKEDLKEEVKEDKSESNFELIDNVSIFPKGKFETIGELGEVKAGPLGEVKKVLIKSEDDKIYEIYLKVMEKGEKIPLPVPEASSIEEKKAFLSSKGIKLDGLSPDIIDSTFNSYKESVISGDALPVVSSLVDKINELTSLVNKMKIESKLKEKINLCSYIVESKVAANEIVPDIDEVNKLVSTGVPFMEARQKVLEAAKKAEMKKLLNLTDDKIQLLYKTYSTLSPKSNSLILGNVSDQELIDSIDTDEVFLKNLPWS